MIRLPLQLSTVGIDAVKKHLVSARLVVQGAASSFFAPALSAGLELSGFEAPSWGYSADKNGWIELRSGSFVLRYTFRRFECAHRADDQLIDYSFYAANGDRLDLTFDRDAIELDELRAELKGLEARLNKVKEQVEALEKKRK